MNSLPFAPLGAVFDVDETILDNGHQTLGVGYHEKFRLQAIHEIGKENDIPELVEMTIEDSMVAFRTAFEHTFSASLWNMLCMAGVRNNQNEINELDPLHLAITVRKNQLYKQALKSEILPIAGAKKLISSMYLLCDGHLAISSTALRIDIDTFLQANDLDKYFTSERIFSLEDLTHAKPHKESFIKGFLSLGLPESARKNVIAFEDAPNGVISAKKAGLYTVAITTHFSKDELMSATHTPDLVIDRYSELTLNI